MNDGGLVFDHFTDARDRVVSRMVVHRQLVLLVLDLGRDGKVDSILQRGQAEIGARSEGLTRVLGDAANTVCGGLSEGGARVAGKSADRLHDALEVLWRKVGGSQVLNHVI